MTNNPHPEDIKNQSSNHVRFDQQGGTKPTQSDDLDNKINELFAEIARSYDEQTVWQVCTKVKALVRSNTPKPTDTNVAHVVGTACMQCGEHLNPSVPHTCIKPTLTVSGLAPTVQGDDWLEDAIAELLDDWNNSTFRERLAAKRKHKTAIQSQLDAAYQRGREDTLQRVPAKVKHILETEYPDQLNTDMTGHGAWDIAQAAVDDIRSEEAKRHG